MGTLDPENTDRANEEITKKAWKENTEHAEIENTGLMVSDSELCTSTLDTDPHQETPSVDSPHHEKYDTLITQTENNEGNKNRSVKKEMESEALGKFFKMLELGKLGQKDGPVKNDTGQGPRGQPEQKEGHKFNQEENEAVEVDPTENNSAKKKQQIL